METLDLQAIAKLEDKAQLLRLLENLMHVIINCPCKELYISRIMSLREVFQAKLMAFIQKILDKNQPPEADNLDEENKFLKRELQKLKQDKQLLNRQLEEAHQHAFEVSQTGEKLLLENRELKNANIDLLADINRFSSPMKGSLLETTGSSELEAQVMQRDQTIVELKNALLDQKKAYLAQIQALKDEGDVANEKLIHLSKVERDLELYKKRLEDLNSYKKKLKEMQDINEAMKDRLNRLDDDSANVGNLKQMMNYYKEQVNVEKEKAATLSLELDDLKESQTELQRNIRELEESRNFQDAKIKTLLQELERANMQTEVGRESEDSFSLIQTDFSDQLKRMERHNQALRNSFDGDMIVRQLNEQLDEAIKQRRGAEDKHKFLSKEISELQEKLIKLTKQYDNYKLETSFKLSELQGDLNDKLTEILDLKAQLTSSTTSKTEVDALSAEMIKLKSDLSAQMQESARLYKEKDEVNTKFMGSNERIHAIQTQLAEKDAYLRAFEREKQGVEMKLSTAIESERIALNELEMMKKSSPSVESPQDRMKCLELERDLMKAKSEINSLMLVLREKDDSIAAMSAEKERLEVLVIQLKCEVQTLTESSDSSEVSRLTKELLTKDAEIRYLQVAKDELADQYNRELKVMSMVVYEVGLDISRLSKHSNE